MYETIEMLTYQFSSREHQGPESAIKVEVRIWFEEGHGMAAEPLSYTLPGLPQRQMRSGIASQLGDAMIEAIVREEFTEDVLDLIVDTDPAFEGMPYNDEPVMSGDEFRQMVGV